jgi:hypothetical protein
MAVAVGLTGVSFPAAAEIVVSVGMALPRTLQAFSKP